MICCRHTSIPRPFTATQPPGTTACVFANRAVRSQNTGGRLNQRKTRAEFRGVLVATPGVELSTFTKLAQHLQQRGAPPQLTICSPVKRDDLEPLLALVTPATKVVVVTAHDRLLFANVLRRWQRTPLYRPAIRDLGDAAEHTERVSRFAREVLPALHQVEVSGPPSVTWVSTTYASPDEVFQLVARAFWL